MSIPGFKKKKPGRHKENSERSRITERVKEELISNVTWLLDERCLADITFIVGKEEFQAHSAILRARAPNFCSQFLPSHLFSQSVEVCIYLHGLTPQDFKLFLRSVYEKDEVPSYEPNKFPWTHEIVCNNSRNLSADSTANISGVDSVFLHETLDKSCSLVSEDCHPGQQDDLDANKNAGRNYKLLDELKAHCCCPVGEDLFNLLKTKEGSDVIFEIDGQKISAHRAILISRSRYFSAMLHGPWMEGTADTICLHDVTYDGFLAVLCYMYGGVTRVPANLGFISGEVLPLADMYGLANFKTVICSELRIEKFHLFHKPCDLCVSNAMEYLKISHIFEIFGCEELTNSCVRWVATYFDRVCSSKGFAQLDKSLHDQILSGIKENCNIPSVMDVFKRCDHVSACVPRVKWAEPTRVFLETLLDSLLELCVARFPSIIKTDNFLSMLKGVGWCTPLIEKVLGAVKCNLNVETCCVQFRAVLQLKETLANNLDLFPEGNVARVEELYSHCKQYIVSNLLQVKRTEGWTNLDSCIRTQILEGAVIVEDFFDGKTTKLPRTPKAPASASRRSGTPLVSETSRSAFGRRGGAVPKALSTRRGATRAVNDPRKSSSVAPKSTPSQRVLPQTRKAPIAGIAGKTVRARLPGGDTKTRSTQKKVLKPSDRGSTDAQVKAVVERLPMEDSSNAVAPQDRMFGPLEEESAWASDGSGQREPPRGAVGSDQREPSIGTVSADQLGPPRGTVAHQWEPPRGAGSSDQREPSRGAVSLDQLGPSNGTVTCDLREPPKGAVSLDQLGHPTGTVSFDQVEPGRGAIPTEGARDVLLGFYEETCSASRRLDCGKHLEAEVRGSDGASRGREQTSPKERPRDTYRRADCRSLSGDGMQNDGACQNQGLASLQEETSGSKGRSRQAWTSGGDAQSSITSECDAVMPLNASDVQRRADQRKSSTPCPQSKMPTMKKIPPQGARPKTFRHRSTEPQATSSQRRIAGDILKETCRGESVNSAAQNKGSRFPTTAKEDGAKRPGRPGIMTSRKLPNTKNLDDHKDKQRKPPSTSHLNRPPWQRPGSQSNTLSARSVKQPQRTKASLGQSAAGSNGRTSKVKSDGGPCKSEGKTAQEMSSRTPGLARPALQKPHFAASHNSKNPAAQKLETGRPLLKKRYFPSLPCGGSDIQKADSPNVDTPRLTLEFPRPASAPTLLSEEESKLPQEEVSGAARGRKPPTELRPRSAPSGTCEREAAENGSSVNSDGRRKVSTGIMSVKGSRCDRDRSDDEVSELQNTRQAQNGESNVTGNQGRACAHSEQYPSGMEGIDHALEDHSNPQSMCAIGEGNETEVSRRPKGITYVIQRNTSQRNKDIPQVISQHLSAMNSASCHDERHGHVQDVTYVVSGASEKDCEEAAPQMRSARGIPTHSAPNEAEQRKSTMKEETSVFHFRTKRNGPAIKGEVFGLESAGGTDSGIESSTSHVAPIREIEPQRAEISKQCKIAPAEESMSDDLIPLESGFPSGIVQTPKVVKGDGGARVLDWMPRGNSTPCAEKAARRSQGRTATQKSLFQGEDFKPFFVTDVEDAELTTLLHDVSVDGDL